MERMSNQLTWQMGSEHYVRRLRNYDFVGRLLVPFRTSVVSLPTRAVEVLVGDEIVRVSSQTEREIDY